MAWRRVAVVLALCGGGMWSGKGHEGLLRGAEPTRATPPAVLQSAPGGGQFSAAEQPAPTILAPPTTPSTAAPLVPIPAASDEPLEHSTSGSPDEDQRGRRLVPIPAEQPPEDRPLVPASSQPGEIEQLLVPVPASAQAATSSSDELPASGSSLAPAPGGSQSTASATATPTAASASPEQTVARALTLPSDGTLTGRPMHLRDLLARTADHRQRRQLIDAYWRLAQAVAEYNACRDCQIQLERWEPRLQAFSAEASIRARWQALAAMIQARCEAARGMLVERQCALAALAQLGPGEAPPLPADLPYVGTYRTYFRELFPTGVGPGRTRLIDQTLPLQQQSIAQRAAALQAADEALRVLDGSARADASAARAALWLLEQRYQQQQRLMQEVVDYNQRIAEYALAVSVPGLDADKLVGMLIKPQSPGGVSRPQPDSSVHPAAAQQPLSTPGQPTRAVPPPGSEVPLSRPATEAPRPQSLPTTQAPRSQAAPPMPGASQPKGPSTGQPLLPTLPPGSERAAPLPAAPSSGVLPSGGGNSPEPSSGSAGASSRPAAGTAPDGVWEPGRGSSGSLPLGESLLPEKGPPNPKSLTPGEELPAEKSSPAEGQLPAEEATPAEVLPTPRGLPLDGARTPKPIVPSTPQGSLVPAKPPAGSAFGPQETTLHRPTGPEVPALVSPPMYGALEQAAPEAKAEQLSNLLHWQRLSLEEKEPLDLLGCLKSAGSADRLAVVESYWQACRCLAEYQLSCEAHSWFDELALAFGPQPPSAEAYMLRMARGAAAAAVFEAQTRLLESQFELATRLGQQNDLAWPLPTTAPHAGPYALRLEALPPAVGVSWSVRPYADSIPRWYGRMVHQAAAVVAADQARSAAVAEYAGDARRLPATLEAMELQVQATEQFLQAQTDYNLAIARYVFSTLSPQAPAERVVQALVVEPQGS